jgi:hypothetical protein
VPQDGRKATLLADPGGRVHFDAEVRVGRGSSQPFGPRDAGESAHAAGRYSPYGRTEAKSAGGATSSGLA